MKKMKKLIAVILAAVMVLALAIPVMANSSIGNSSNTPETYTINITAPDASNAHDFNAYQIFAGTLSSDDTLTDVTWGRGINSGKLSDLYIAIKGLSGSGNNSPFANLNPETAASVSDILSANKDDTTLVNAFQELITSKGEDGNYNYLSSTTTKISHTDSAADGVYTATDVPAGYYVVVDEAATNTAKLMLKVVGNVNVNAKMDIPSVTKYAGDKDVTDNAKFSVGDEIPYTLIGTTPNFSTGGYSYKFTDTMDETLDLVYTPSDSNPEQVTGGVKVTIGTGEGAVDITNKFTITYKNHVLTIESNTDLKDSGLTANSEIYVTYKAIANSGISVGTGINNKVVVESQMDTDEQTKTPEVKEQVYPITVKIIKVDGSEDTKVLPGAKFKLYRTVDEATQWATTDAEGNFTGWTTTEANAATLTTDENGQITLVGIGAGEFYLQETEAPSGYNKLSEDLKIVIQSTSTTSATGTVKLSELKYSLGTGSMVTDGVDLDNGMISFDVENNKGATLPSTGGIGTTIFYVIGAIIVVGAAVILITRRRMNAGR